MTYKEEGTPCFNCSRVVDCKRVSPSVTSCELFIRSYMPQKEIAKIMDCSVRTVERHLRKNPNKFINALASKITGELKIEKWADGRIHFWRKDSVV